MLKIVLQLYFIIYVKILASDTPEVKLEQGELKGAFQKTWKGRTFSSFTGIPYAEPPVGNLRFKAPLPASPWNGILDAAKPHPMCPQINLYFGDSGVIGDENCLFLNVYTPQISASNESLPVMYFLHGGGLMSGGAPLYGPEILLDQNVVLVTANYRLDLITPMTLARFYTF